MATYLPPSENLPIFDTSVFDETNGAYLTYTSAKKLFLTYPTAQGEETIASLIAGSIDYTSPASGSYFEIGTNQVSGGTIRIGPTGTSSVSVHAGNIDCTNNTINNATDAAANNLALGNSQTTGVLNIGTGVRTTGGNGGAINIGGGSLSTAPINIGPISAIGGSSVVNINTSTTATGAINIGSSTATTNIKGPSTCTGLITATAGLTTPSSVTATTSVITPSITTSSDSTTLGIATSQLTGILNIGTAARTGVGAINIGTNSGTTAPINIGGTNTSATAGTLSSAPISINGSTWWTNLTGALSLRTASTIDILATFSSAINIGSAIATGNGNAITIGSSGSSASTTISSTKFSYGGFTYYGNTDFIDTIGLYTGSYTVPTTINREFYLVANVGITGVVLPTTTPVGQIVSIKNQTTGNINISVSGGTLFVYPANTGVVSGYASWAMPTGNAQRLYWNGTYWMGMA